MVTILTQWVMRLATSLGMLSYYIMETNDRERCALAPTIFADLFQILARPLGQDSERVSNLAERHVPRQSTPSNIQQSAPSNNRQETTPVCRVCLDRVPNAVLRACGHVCCQTCVDRLHRCPVCRATILGWSPLFF